MSEIYDFRRSSREAEPPSSRYNPTVTAELNRWPLAITGVFPASVPIGGSETIQHATIPAGTRGTYRRDHALELSESRQLTAFMSATGGAIVRIGAFASGDADADAISYGCIFDISSTGVTVTRNDGSGSTSVVLASPVRPTALTPYTLTILRSGRLVGFSLQVGGVPVDEGALFPLIAPLVPIVGFKAIGAVGDGVLGPLRFSVASND